MTEIKTIEGGQKDVSSVEGTKPLKEKKSFLSRRDMILILIFYISFEFKFLKHFTYLTHFSFFFTLPPLSLSLSLSHIHIYIIYHSVSFSFLNFSFSNQIFNQSHFLHFTEMRDLCQLQQTFFICHSITFYCVSCKIILDQYERKSDEARLNHSFLFPVKDRLKPV